MFVNEDYQNYKYVVSNSDNYLVLSNVRSVYASYDNPDDINVLVQYIQPSDLCYTTTMTFYQNRTFPQIDVTDSNWSRADISHVFIVSFFIILLTLFVYNTLSKIFVRGGFCR